MPQRRQVHIRTMLIGGVDAAVEVGEVVEAFALSADQTEPGEQERAGEALQAVDRGAAAVVARPEASAAKPTKTLARPSRIARTPATES